MDLLTSHRKSLLTQALVSASDLGLLKRDRKLQQRYDLWAIDIKNKYGSIGNFLCIHPKSVEELILNSGLSHEIPPAMGKTR